MKGNYNEENTHVYYNVVMKFDGGINLSKPPWRGVEHVTEVAGFVPPYVLELKCSYYYVILIGCCWKSVKTLKMVKSHQVILS